jgi:hypothetical protein
MKKRTAWMLSLLSMGAATWIADASAQQPPGYPASPYGQMAGPGGPMMPMRPMYPHMPAGYMQGPGMQPGMQTPAMGSPSDVAGPDAGPIAPYPEGGGMEGPAHGYGGEGYGYGGDAYCPPGMAGGAYESAGFKRRLRFLRWLLPYDDGGCCAPHWFDVHAEYLHLTREEVSDSVGLVSDTPLGPIVLGTDDLELDDASGARVTLTMQVGVGSNLEVTYLGGFRQSDSASVFSPTNSLFSIFSDFGTFPVPGQGFTETDQAALATVAFASEFHNVELNFRQRWQGYGCKLQGSYLGGVRYFQLNEDFNFITEAPLNNASMNYDIDTYNELVGLQVGGDIWACVIPGLSIGAEGKVGIYHNDARQKSLLTATTVNPPLSEAVEDNDVSFVGEAGLMATWRVTQSWTVRGGYQFLYVTGVALAAENLNPTPPFLVPAFTNPPRTASLNTDGDVFYHGFTIGLEYMW